MNKTVFPYTTMAEVDSSMAKAVYYNALNGEMAIEMYTGVAVYEDVPTFAYERLIQANSVGSTYNRSIKYTYHNKYGTTVHGVTFDPIDEIVEKSEKTFTVRAFVEFEVEITAGSLEEAVTAFHENHNDVDGIKIKEVVVPFER